MRESAVAITFDACAIRTKGYDFDRAVFEILKRERVPATIFVSGRWVESHPTPWSSWCGEPLIEFGDHSYDHPHMSHLDAARIGEPRSIRPRRRSARYGKRSVAFRPPFGEWSQRLIDVARDAGAPDV